MAIYKTRNTETAKLRKYEPEKTSYLDTFRTLIFVHLI